MQLFYEIFPVFLFFLAFKFYDIYVATIVGMATTLIQVLATRIIQKTWDKKQLITFFVFLIFGSMTLYFHDPIFVKWKPTIVFWIFALVLLITQLFTQKPLIQRLLENVLQDKGEVPRKIWGRLNVIWILFFSALGAVNLYIAYHFSNDTWVNFKFYGVTLALFLLSLFQAFYLMKFMSPPRAKE